MQKSMGEPPGQSDLIVQGLLALVAAADIALLPHSEIEASLKAPGNGGTLEIWSGKWNEIARLRKVSFYHQVDIRSGGRKHASLLRELTLVCDELEMELPRGGHRLRLVRNSVGIEMPDAIVASHARVIGPQGLATSRLVIDVGDIVVGMVESGATQGPKQVDPGDCDPT